MIHLPSPSLSPRKSEALVFSLQDSLTSFPSFPSTSFHFFHRVSPYLVDLMSSLVPFLVPVLPHLLTLPYLHTYPPPLLTILFFFSSTLLFFVPPAYISMIACAATSVAFTCFYTSNQKDEKSFFTSGSSFFFFFPITVTVRTILIWGFRYQSSVSMQLRGYKIRRQKTLDSEPTDAMRKSLSIILVQNGSDETYGNIRTYK